MPQPAYLIGVDTGGTYTDCAVIEARGHQVVASAKAITTKGDLSIGVTEAINQAVAQMAGRVAAQDIGLVSVSTTLATNAVVEGHGSPVAVVLVGFDVRMAERTGIAAAFPGVALLRIDGGHDHNGAEARPLDLAALDRALDEVAGGVDAFAVASLFAVRNAAHEHAVRERILARTGKPVTVSTELSSSLDAPRRALTAALNARLIARVTLLIDAVARAMEALQIRCPLMIVKGDGTLALAETVARKPIETVLSGPAASLIGARWLSGLSSFILSDMGGTTTDLGVLQDGRPRVSEQGAEVGGWRTMVRAIDVRTIGLGGDSEVHLPADGGIVIGPQRVVPVALLGQRFADVLRLLRADLDDVERGSALHGRFVLLPFGARAGVPAAGLGMRERALLERVTEQPQPLRKLVAAPSEQRALASLARKGLVQLAALTPSDAAHVLGLQHNWSAEAAQMAAALACRLREMRQPTPERVRAFAQAIWSETVRQSAHAVLETAFGGPLGANNSLVDAVCSGAARVALVQVGLSPTLPVVAVGAPVGVYYDAVGERLACRIVTPAHRAVANAVGAATGVVAQSVTVRVDGDGSGGFRLHSSAGTRAFDDPARALDAATDLARRSASDAVRAMGAADPQVQISVRKQHLPNAQGDAGLLEAVVTAEAIGRPAAAA